MAWFSYLILSLNTIFQIYSLVFALSGVGGENNVSGMKRGVGIKMFEKHWFRSKTLIRSCKMIT